MKKSFVLFFVVFVSLGLFFISASSTKVQDIKYSHVKVQKSDVKSSESAIVKRDPDFGNIPLYFIPNKGQVDEKARFYAKTSRYTLWMTKEGLVFDSVQSSGAIDVNEYTGNNHSKFKIQNSKLIKRDVSRLIFLDSNKNPEILPIKMTPHKVNYFKGKDPSKWQAGIRTSKAVLYKGIYKNIDLKVYGIEKQVEYDWIVKPGADPKQISFKYEQVTKTRIDKEGNLIVETKFGELMHKKPVSYQVIDGKRVPVKSTFKKVGKNTYGFKVKKYNRDFELIIDPMVCPIYSTYLGGSSNDYGCGIAVDSDGYSYVTGITYSTDFPTENSYHIMLNGSDDAFVTKLSPTDGCPVYSTYLGGSGNDCGSEIAVDSNGSAYVTGYTQSTNFPTKNPYQGARNGYRDVFVTKLSPGGNTLLYSTYLGGSYDDYSFGIAVDSNGGAYVTGDTRSTNFPTKNSYQGTLRGERDVFVTKLSPGGNTLLYSTYLGGSTYDYGRRIAVDSNGSAYVTGGTDSTNFPTHNACQNSLAGGYDAFVSRFCFCDSAPVLVVNKTLLNFAKNNWGYTTDSQSFLIRNIGEGTLNWSVSDDADWLTCSPASGTNFGEVTVSVDASGLEPCTYTGTITVSDNNAINSPQTIPVTLRVYGPMGQHPSPVRPFGFFETPEDGATVSGSVPFTGWVLDDIEVVSVKLCLGNCKDSTYIGEATFVEGARPDVAQVYPEYPYCNRAGWGYLMLTNALDDGTYVVHAEAGDREGNWVTLGTKTITIDNANAVKPFGTIDTPTPGGNASGSNYRVLGWALTPPPNKIPSDGVHLYVDGVDLGETTYDIFRQDVYDLFPGYENRDGALAYYDLNTLGCDNGMHTVHFVATDNAVPPNTDGIGSRYFNIWNLGTINSVSQASGQKFYSMPEIIKIPVDYSRPVNMKKGYNSNIEPETVYPDEKGNITIEIKELERMVIHLSEVQADVEVEEKGSKNSKFKIQNSKLYSGYQVTGDRLTPLPIGSTMDTEKGVFYWIPGPGFIGEYRLVFVEKDANGAMNKKLIKVKIVPKFGK